MLKLIIAALLVSQSQIDINRSPSRPIKTLDHNETVQAPFGMVWGEPISHLAEFGSRARIVRSRKQIQIRKLYNLRRPVKFAYSFYLMYDGDIGLQKIIMKGNPIRDEGSGDKGKEMYFDFKRILAKKYGEPVESAEYAFRKNYKKPWHFYRCLSYKGCGKYVSLFEVKGMTIVLSLQPGDTMGEIVIEYFGPKWNLVLERYNNTGLYTGEDAL